MKPEAILQSDVLDILFENRNKDYGAYTLRKNYNQRLIQALGGTFLVVGLFVLLQSMRARSDQSAIHIFPPDTQLTDVIIEPRHPEDDQPEKPRQRQATTPTIDHQTPVITDNPVETEVPTIADLDGRAIDDHTNDAPSVDGDPPFDPGEPTGTSQPGATVPVSEPEDTGPLLHADVMPTFNGDIVRYMQRHLRQPSDLETGERITVRVRFVVNEEGNISDIQVVQSGRSDLDDEVVRVVKKMPRWNPGMQGGRKVAVFFNMPVTFLSNEE